MELTLAEIKKLMEDFKAVGLGEMEIKQGDFELKFTSENYVNKSFELQKSIIENTSEAKNTSFIEDDTEEQPQQQEVKGTYLNAPVVGTIYTSPSPSDEPFIKVGDRVSKGQVVFVIESMKLLNEVICDMDGEIAEILVDNAQSVEYGQPILRIV
ncbi:MAG: acetyl-CoA carboxylase biotin carboxyl carrier protein [Oscillospiraceae bacterium]